jgi:hypothetical protein
MVHHNFVLNVLTVVWYMHNVGTIILKKHSGYLSLCLRMGQVPTLWPAQFLLMATSMKG